ncbi:hypothetical protein AMATHDRAFT_155773 [Amanita thiersii Skay4041]|uniref:Magnesium transport protein CorA n=1 Tax=Amanita thiersii Skay4041 TaxID=703135 RepID=A0A2A9N7U9_9AGAR|nr:hypothetical protein AMATHDRAFT_155773 [Amanita thiersii Skay4041]
MPGFPRAVSHHLYPHRHRHHHSNSSHLYPHPQEEDEEEGEEAERPTYSGGANTRNPRIPSRPSRSSRPSRHDTRFPLFLLRRRFVRAGAEQGVNPRQDGETAGFGHVKQECVIEVVDYGSSEGGEGWDGEIRARRVGNQGLIDILREEKEREERERGGGGGGEGGQKEGVRWINIGGIDWDVLSTLALHYDLHSLALEDVLHEQGHNHSKVDYYQAHLFLRVLCHWVDRTSDQNTQGVDGSLGLQCDAVGCEAGTGNPRRGVESSGRQYVQNPEMVVSKRRGNRKAQVAPGGTLPAYYGDEGDKRVEKMRRISALKGDRVIVRHEPLFIFLLPDGTVISVHPEPNLEFTKPIAERLHKPDSVLRTSVDASILVESLLDLVVDRVLEVIDEYQSMIHELEHDILLETSMNTVRKLHILSGDLIMHRRTLEPIRRMIDGLRRYDVDRCAALAQERSAEDLLARKWGSHHQDAIQRGYLSHRAKVYLADVYDHIDFALMSLEMFAGISENLIDYAFNVKVTFFCPKHKRRLTLVTIIFLPLTLLTGYFGMNFEFFWSVSGHTEFFFWKIAIPVMVALVPILLYSQIIHMVQNMRNRFVLSQVGRT